MDLSKNKVKVKEIYGSDWQEALAELTYLFLSSFKSKYIDEYEQKRDMEQYKKLLSELENFDSGVNWRQIMEAIANQIAHNYVNERVTGKNFAPGGPLTLIGHTSHIFIEWGFLSNIASSLDGGKARDLYNDYVSIDRAFKQAINSGDASTGYKLADKWRIAQNSINQEYENLLELLGLAQTDWD
jgi:hypothetical protein